MAEALNPSVQLIEDDEENINKFSESWATTQMRIVKHRHTWTLYNFSACAEAAEDDLLSPPFFFQINGFKSEWCLNLYAKGMTKEDKDAVALFVKLVEYRTNEKLDVKCNFGFVNAAGQNIKLRTLPKCTIAEDSECGFKRLVKQDFLLDPQNEAVINDKVSFYCEIFVELACGSISGINRKSAPIDVSFLHDNREFSDVTIYAGGREFSAHKIILAVRSPVFRAMFRHDMEESRTNRVEIEDIDGECMCEVLRYIYTGKIEKMEQLASSLLSASEKYHMDDLKAACENGLYKCLTPENAADILILSDTFRAGELRTKTKEYIAVNASVVGQTAEFQSMIKANPELGVEVLLFVMNFNSSDD